MIKVIEETLERSWPGLSLNQVLFVLSVPAEWVDYFGTHCYFMDLIKAFLLIIIFLLNSYLIQELFFENVYLGQGLLMKILTQT